MLSPRPATMYRMQVDHEIQARLRQLAIDTAAVEDITLDEAVERIIDQLRGVFGDDDLQE